MLSLVSLLLLPLSYAQDDCPSSSDETPSLCITTDNNATEGFTGDENNKYVLDLQVYRGCVYAATLNADDNQEPVFISLVSFALGKGFSSDGGQIWRGCTTGADGELVWTQVVDDGLSGNQNMAIYDLQAVDDYLYATTFNNQGFELLRTVDGTNWNVMDTAGITNDTNIGGRSMMVWKGALYIGTENRVIGAQVLRRELDDDGDFASGSSWQVVADLGFTGVAEPFGPGGPIQAAVENWWCELQKWNGKLWCGTLNPDGAQLWYTEDGTPEGNDDWENAFIKGNGCSTNFGITTLDVFEGELYVGMGNILQGASLYVSGGEEPGEQSMVFWLGDEPDEFFKPVFLFGNGNRFNWAILDCQGYEGRLYCGTLDLLDTLGTIVFGGDFPIRRRMQDNTFTKSDMNTGPLRRRLQAIDPPFFRGLEFLIEWLEAVILNVVQEFLQNDLQPGSDLVSSGDPDEENFIFEFNDGLLAGLDGIPATEGSRFDGVGALAVLDDELIIGLNVDGTDVGANIVRASALETDEESSPASPSGESDDSDDSSSSNDDAHFVPAKLDQALGQVHKVSHHTNNNNFGKVHKNPVEHSYKPHPREYQHLNRGAGQKHVEQPVVPDDTNIEIALSDTALLALWGVVAIIAMACCGFVFYRKKNMVFQAPETVGGKSFDE